MVNAKWIWSMVGCAIVSGCLAPDFVVDPPKVAGAGGTTAGAAGTSNGARAGTTGNAASRAGSAGNTSTSTSTAGMPGAGSAGKSSTAGYSGTGALAAGGSIARAGASNARAGQAGQAGAGGFGGTAGTLGGAADAANAGKPSSAGTAGTASPASAGSAGSTGFTGSTHPSCLSLPNVCQGESCCVTLPVPAGTFSMGRSESTGSDVCPSSSCSADELPEHQVTIAGFYLDKYEVTVGRFRQFVNTYSGAASAPKANLGLNPNVPSSGWNTSWNANLPSANAVLTTALACGDSPTNPSTYTATPGSNEDLPINCVDWYTAFAFCIWDNGRLPTEAEWEYAAAGGSENRLFPWGSTLPDDAHALYYGVNGKPIPIAVGSKTAGAGKWKHLDLAGGMVEWNFDAYDANWYATAAAAGSNPANRGTGTTAQRSARGGSWSDGTGFLRAAARFPLADATRRSTNFGIRCARDVP